MFLILIYLTTDKDITVGKDGNSIPGTDPSKRITYEMVQAAMKNFLNMQEIQIREALTDSLQGNMLKQRFQKKERERTGPGRNE